MSFPNERNFKESAYFSAFIAAHILLSVAFLLVLTFPSFEPVSLIQEYPLKKIKGCVPSTSEMLALTLTDILLFFYSQVIPFSLHLTTITALVVLLIRQTRSMLVLTNQISLGQFNYVILMMVNIALGWSLILQELPFTVIMLVQFAYGDITSWGNCLYLLGVATSKIFLSYSIGYQMDLLIYANLCSKFKGELN